MKRNRIVAAAVIALLVIAVAGGAWWSTQSARTTVAAATASTQTLDVTVNAKGTIAPDAQSTVTAPAAGTLASVAVTDGQNVDAGQLLGTMDTTPLDAAVARAEADYAAARAMPTGTDRLNRARDAATHAAQLALDAARANRDKAELKAPVAGTVQFTSLSLAPGLPALFTTAPGVAVTEGLTLFTVVEPSSLRFDAAVDESDIAGVQAGQSASVTLDAFADEPFSGTVAAVRPVAVSTSTGGVAFTTVITLDAAGKTLMNGMTGDVDIATASIPDALVVPVQAVVSDGAGRFVWVIDGGAVRRVAVEVGASSDTLTQITSGLDAGVQVATTNLTALTEGARVDVQ
ncbi:efflux RND transporter periplasmic adaptor subunit [Propioniciclava sp.]|uniref:efflux RND transporter periplasmic adaptor subunit n=1 Tax=Propioniciclava sp. TaxID=2038686 RepID=UPI00261AF76D|nr:efflux RND transporter periplasmic adaptor subunit [Propioniciclava sp.]